ncbi:hypothetical protein CIT26_10340 [Mesorhizobium temperatum]|uniref:Chitooligosaccharide deacetylase n=1 Tax=Mesorhizobium temperatum TaxID=241416 RepID=A0A271LP73_9HYPH|nr:polysaccharide deacetylase family protein [Mesorhizobium temperatum]PAQ09962.1 hypothetical protein CIT26_10340 [Mesorhizobium temperatum]
MRSDVRWRLCWENELQLADHVELSDFFRKTNGRTGAFNAKPFEGGRSWAGARPEFRAIGYDAHGVAAHIGILRRSSWLSRSDDGPNPLCTPEILDVLAQHRVPATFFVIGAYAADQPELIRPPQAVGLCESHKLGEGQFSQHGAAQALSHVANASWKGTRWLIN